MVMFQLTEDFSSIYTIKLGISKHRKQLTKYKRGKIIVSLRPVVQVFTENKIFPKQTISWSFKYMPLCKLHYNNCMHSHILHNTRSIFSQASENGSHTKKIFGMVLKAEIAGMAYADINKQDEPLLNIES